MKLHPTGARQLRESHSESRYTPAPTAEASETHQQVLAKMRNPELVCHWRGPRWYSHCRKNQSDLGLGKAPKSSLAASSQTHVP